jgi:hypothetical protein
MDPNPGMSSYTNHTEKALNEYDKDLTSIDYIRNNNSKNNEMKTEDNKVNKYKKDKKDNKSKEVKASKD